MLFDMADHPRLLVGLVVLSRSYHIDCVCLSYMCLDPVMGCRKHDVISGMRYCVHQYDDYDSQCI